MCKENNNLENEVNQEIDNEAVEKSIEEKLSEEINKKNDMMLRLAAEYENFKKRSQRERACSFVDSKVTTITEILPVIDNFERAIQDTTANLEDYKKGVEMTYNQFIEILQKLDVEAFGEIGDSFDAMIHEAVMHDEDENFGENVIAEVFKKGYRLGERVLRHAVVKVAN